MAVDAVEFFIPYKLLLFSSDSFIWQIFVS